MREFEYFEPATIDEAVALLHNCKGKASVLAGGTDLLVQIKEHVRHPDHVVNIKKLPGLDDLVYDEEKGLRIGALVTTRAVETSPIVRKLYPSLAKAVTDFASIQVRNRATVVGNICRASPSADSLPPLIADGAFSGDQVIMPLLDDAADLLATGVAGVRSPVARRTDLKQLSSDWNNAYQAILFDLEEGLRRAPNDEARLALMQKVRATLAPAGVLSGPPPTNGVATDAAPAARPREGERE